MDKAARSKLLRDLLKARKPSSAVVPKAKARHPKWWKVYGTGKIAGGAITLGEGRKEPWNAEWVVEPDAKPKVVPRPKRGSGDSAIARAVEKAQPKKLVRAYQNAEQLLAERVRQ